MNSWLLMGRRGMDLVNRGLSVMDLLWAGDRNLVQPGPVFIVGSPRCGSTLTLQVLLQTYEVSFFPAPMAYLYGAANLVFRLTSPWLAKPVPLFESNYGHITGWLAPTESANFWFRWLPKDGPLGHSLPADASLEPLKPMARAISSLAVIAGRPLAVKCLYLSMNVGVLARLLPGALFLHVRRDPMLTIQSMFEGRRKQRDPRQWWSIKVPHYRDRMGDPLWLQVTDQYHLVEAILARDLAQYASGRHHALDYAELCANPRLAMEKLAPWLASAGICPRPTTVLPKHFVASHGRRIDLETWERIAGRLEELAGKSP